MSKTTLCSAVVFAAVLGSISTANADTPPIGAPLVSPVVAPFVPPAGIPLGVVPVSYACGGYPDVEEQQCDITCEIEGGGPSPNGNTEQEWVWRPAMTPVFSRPVVGGDAGPWLAAISACNNASDALWLQLENGGDPDTLPTPPTIIIPPKPVTFY